MIIGEKGIALSYVIREDNTPNPKVFQPWESMATLVAHHDGSTYDQYKLTVHNIIIQNISNGSDAYTYIKPRIKRDNGRIYIKVLRGRYENATMCEQYVNKANRVIETVVYRNERAIKFEKFIAKFTQAVDELEKRNWGLYNSEVVDLIRKKIMSPELSQ